MQMEGKMNKNYDVVIIGAGISGIFAGYELTKLNPKLKVLMLEQGRDIFKRNCPTIGNKIKDCVKCKTCDIMRGFGGAGAYSDGKFNFTTEFGGWLNDYLPDEEVMKLIDYVDKVNMEFGATDEVFSTYSAEAKAIEKRALENDLHLLQASVKHLGTENNVEILKRLYNYLTERLEMQCNTQVKQIAPHDEDYIVTLSDGTELQCKYLIAAPGRSGAEWFSQQCKDLNLNLINNQVDIGVRVELPAKVLEHITDVVYESKL